MQDLFGVPTRSLAVVLGSVLAVAFVVVGVLVLRQPILLTLGWRNAWRRKGRSALIVLGLMLATAIITSALVTGDTITHTIRSSVTSSLGNTDEMIAVEGAQSSTADMLGAPVPIGYFPQATADQVAAQLADVPHVDATTPAVIEQVAVQDGRSRQNEPQVTVFSPADMRGLGPITSDGRRVSLSDLGPGEVYLDVEAADALDARPGDPLLVLAGSAQSPATVRAVVTFDGGGTTEAGMLAPLGTTQAMLDRPGQVNRVLVSNDGGAFGGERYSSSVVSAATPIVAPYGLEAVPVKSDAIDDADEIGNTFMQLFTTFGTFSISAGLLLIFLIFVMLAAERRGEMGIARAVGMQRRHLVQTFLFEGLIYDVAAAIAGVILGVGVAFAMVSIMSSALDSSSGLSIERSAQTSSIVVGGCIGLLLTLVVVAASAWRVSRLDIVAAIRNLTEPGRRARRLTWLRVALGLLAGLLLAVSGRSSGQVTTFMLGVSLVAISVASLARAAGAPPRPAYTIAGAFLVVWWSLPFGLIRSLVPDASMDFSMWVVAGLMVVLGMSWLIVYNADLLLAGVMALFGRIRSVAPVLKTSIAYPLRSRFRTGITLAMFTLVVFTLVVGSTTTNAFTGAFDDVESYGGGFDVQASTSPFSPVPDMESAVRDVPGLPADAVRDVGAQSVVPVDAAQVGTGQDPVPYVVRGLDDSFLAHTTYGFATMATGYDSAEQVWQALADDPHLAVVDAMVVPRRDNWSFGSIVDLKLSGFHIEDDSFTPVHLGLRDPQTGATVDYTVIGVLKDTASLGMLGISASQQSVSAAFGERAVPTIFDLTLADGVDPAAAARMLESSFLANGMQADAFRDLLSDTISANRTMQRIVLGFMALGLIVGIAALGVISARSVVERRAHIGVMRAIGFQRRMVQSSFLIEASFISLVAIVVGSVLGLVCAHNVIADAATQPTYSGIEFVVPWGEFAGVFVAVYAAAMLATYGPARRAASTYPAEALRYQ
ncbi:ABC transporter permease [Trujillonella endophytica]|uniref:Putative ABC transport system permease protein n=1 Tax=Trujillonella endophytica TaxID=673521 RepID=A0A1H8T1Y5_9ACTN|nr:FtsX-like permease family protein [Trujillella endophytica]SEO84608.1 putative ABC transport system permease protein [Trujillella endophytica]